MQTKTNELKLECGCHMGGLSFLHERYNDGRGFVYLDIDHSTNEYYKKMVMTEEQVKQLISWLQGVLECD